jgi:hypothetical protein
LREEPGGPLTRAISKRPIKRRARRLPRRDLLAAMRRASSRGVRPDALTHCTAGLEPVIYATAHDILDQGEGPRANRWLLKLIYRYSAFTDQIGGAKFTYGIEGLQRLQMKQTM